MTTILARRHYSAARGGHAPGHLRDALLACFEDPDSAAPWWETLGDTDALSFYDPAKQAAWETKSTKERARWLTGQLWNCSDILPGDVVTQLLELAERSNDPPLPNIGTYATAARFLRGSLA